jgi:hypothetical protein
MLDSRKIEGDVLKRFRSLLVGVEEKVVPYGVQMKFQKFFDGAEIVIFDRESLYAVSKKGMAEDYELDFNVRENIQLLGYFGAALQKLDDI